MLQITTVYLNNNAEWLCNLNMSHVQLGPFSIPSVSIYSSVDEEESSSSSSIESFWEILSFGIDRLAAEGAAHLYSKTREESLDFDSQERSN